MPYRIITLRESHEITRYEAVSDIAADTLAQARIETRRKVNGLAGGTSALASVARLITERGGTIGPLHDGTMIEVRPVEWRVLRAARITTHYVPEGDHAAILAAYNDL